MELTVTARAKDIIDEWREPHHQYLWLYYDTDDCGCGVSGLPTVRLTDKTTDLFKTVNNSDYKVIIHKQQATFFAEKITLDYIGNSFRLFSPEGILNPIIPVSDIVKGDVA